jgi:ABC-type multidrug transport system fused ATPase/permease subunit
MIQQNRSAWIGYSILISAVTYLLGLTTELPIAIPALFAWIAVALAMSAISRSARKQTFILLGLGLLMIFGAYLYGTTINWNTALSGNLPMLTMFVAVSFLSLTNPQQSQTVLERGKKGILSNLLTCHLLGAVINISIVFVVGDRLSQNKKITSAQTMTMMRGFTAAAFWSPFFVATGVALTYAPGAQWLQTLLPGMVLTLPLIIYTFWDAWRREGEDFEGYPLRVESLFMPFILATAVLCGHWLIPDLKILTLISLLAPLGALIFMSERPRVQHTTTFIQQRLANIASQFALFLAAGVFSAGLIALIDSFPELLRFNIPEFSSGIFMICSGGMILIALIGVHPIVSVALISPFLTPLQIDPNQLAFLFLSVWGIATGTSPLSGVGLAMSGRYNVSGSAILKMNRKFLIYMWLVSGLVNYLWFH